LLFGTGSGGDGLPLDLCGSEERSGCVGKVHECDLILGEGADFGALSVGKGGLCQEDVGSGSQADFELAFFGLVKPAVEDGSLPAGEDSLPVGLNLVDGVEDLQLDEGFAGLA